LHDGHSATCYLLRLFWRALRFLTVTAELSSASFKNISGIQEVKSRRKMRQKV
jgi:hypothetical protein